MEGLESQGRVVMTIRRHYRRWAVALPPRATQTAAMGCWNTNHWVQFEENADVTSAFRFSGFTTIGNYPPRTFDPGTKAYIPFSSALPFNLPGPNAVAFMLFSYQTPNAIDPGPFVFLQ